VLGAVLLAVTAVAIASSIDVAVVDVTAPTGTVALAPGGSGAIIINMNVTGNQVGTATFKVYRDWTLSGGVFTGSNPQTFTVSPRTSQDPATLFSTTGTVTVVAGQASGPFTLAVSAYDITNSNDTGAKLSDGADSNYQVIVAAPSDITPPVITVPANITAEATGPGGAVVTFTASADDAVDGDVPVTCVPASGSTFPIGTTTVNATATDAHHNVAHASFTVTVQDTTAPTISGVPADITKEATSAAGAVVTWTAPSATDAVDPTPSISVSPASGSTFSLGTTTVTVTATDLSGNSRQKTFTVTVQDKTAPTISGVPADITKEATSAAGAVVTWTAPSATDAVDPSPSVSASPASASTFSIGTTTVTVTATDATGNTSSKTFKITVRDTTAPAITVPDDIVAEATSAAGAVVNFSVSATDAVDPSPSVSASPASGSTFSIGTTTVTVTATDASGNTSSKTFKVTVVYRWGGILPPVNPDGSSIFKLGSTVPVKFRLTYAGGGVVSTVVAKLSLSKLTNAIWGDEVEAISTAAATTDNLFRYDASGNLYIFNLATKGLTAGTYRLTIVLDDGTSHTVEISLRK